MARSGNACSGQPVGVVLLPFQKFSEVQAAGGILLLIATLGALIWANAPWPGGYTSAWETELSIGLGEVRIVEPLGFWINDGLMAVFFFVLGLEIKRELLAGELASRRQAMLPIIAALGGIAVPASIYVAVNVGGSGANGWGIPMATDTAFALGILGLLGGRIPLTLKILLTALAIIDDIGALLVIALFYTDELSWFWLAIAGALLGLLAATNRIGLRHPAVYAVLGVGLWVAFLHSGVHPTLAGVLLATMIPAWSHINSDQFLSQARGVLHQFEEAGDPQESVLANAQRQSAFLELGVISERVETPLQRLEHRLHPLVSFAIMPLFALANAGLALNIDVVSGITHPVGLGIVLGLAIGKPLGVVSAAWLAVRSGLAALPAGLGWRHITGLGWLAGIGFTMSIFITNLAFGTEPSLLSDAKIGILVGSLVSGLVGWLVLRGTRAAAAEDSR